MTTIRELLERNPNREITSFIRITEHDPKKVWAEMDEYVPTDSVKTFFQDMLGYLSETRNGTTERVCTWISGFFGSGKSHFLKTLGYLLKNLPLEDPDGHSHYSQEFLCRKIGIDPNHIAFKELKTEIVFINLLNNDPQSPIRPTISRLVYRGLLESAGFSIEFWVAAWEKELLNLGKWQEFLDWVKNTYHRDWSQERRLGAEIVLKRALPQIMNNRYHSEEEAAQAILDCKQRLNTVNPSDVVDALRQTAEILDPTQGRMVVLLDEVGLYIGDSIERLTDLNALAEQVVQAGHGKVLLVVTAQEALTDLVPRLTADRQILEWLKDRFKVRFGLQPTEVQKVVGERLLTKTAQGVTELRALYIAHQGRLIENLSLVSGWGDEDFIRQYPFPPYAVPLIQDIMGAMRGSIDEMRRLSGSQRSMIKLTQALLNGEGGITVGADQSTGWMASLDAFYDALRPDLTIIRGEQVRAIEEIKPLGAVDGLSIQRVAKALFLLQQVSRRYPCTLENISSALVGQVNQDLNVLREAVRKALEKMYNSGWVVPEEGKYRLLTPEEHDLESLVRRNWPTVSELTGERGTFALLKELLSSFRYEHGNIRRPLKVAFTLDDSEYLEEGDLQVELISPLSDVSPDQVMGDSIAEPHKIFWQAADHAEIKPLLERRIAIRKTLDQPDGRALTPLQQEHKDRLDREANTIWQTQLPGLMKQAFMRGKVYSGGQELAPASGDFAAALRAALRSIATQLYTEFVDDRPEKDEECAAILGWTPGTVLPSVFNRLNLIAPDNRILHDAALLATIKAELTRRTNLGLDRSGKELADHFSNSPYGWDPRLIRMLFATYFKAGKVSVNDQGREYTDPSDNQVRSLLVLDREFRHLTFALLPDVDWRAASAQCSNLFGVQGGDTFESTARIVQEQCSQWAQQANQLATRCKDNGLAVTFSQSCSQAFQILQEIAVVGEPNARLGRLLVKAPILQTPMAQVRKLKTFDFDQFRKLSQFQRNSLDWANGLEGEVHERIQRLTTALTANDLLDRIAQMKEDYGFLLIRFRQDYQSRHAGFQQAIVIAIQSAQLHPAFIVKPEEATVLLQPLEALKCSISTPQATEDNLSCHSCQRSFNNLSNYLVEDVLHRAEADLDGLLPPPPPGDEPLPPLNRQEMIHNQDELNQLARDLRLYLGQAKCPIKVHVEAEPVKGDN